MAKLREQKKFAFIKRAEQGYEHAAGSTTPEPLAEAPEIKRNAETRGALPMPWLNDAEVRTKEDQLEEARQSAVSLTLSKIDEFGRRFTVDTPRIEQDGWTIKAQAAMQLVNGDETPGMIHFEAQEKGVDPLVLAQKVLEKSQAYGGICALISAIRSKALDDIRAAQSYAEIQEAMQRNFDRARERAKEFGVDFP